MADDFDKAPAKIAVRVLALVVVALIVVAGVAYLRPLLFGDTFVSRDHLTHSIPAKTMLADSLAAGNFPEWWPSISLGVPFASNPNHSALYPPVWLVSVLPMPWAVDFLLILHLLFAGIGVATLSLRLGADGLGATIAGAAFMLGGFVTSVVVHGGPLYTLAWLPWILCATDWLSASDGTRRIVQRGLVIALLMGAQLLAGDPSFCWLSGLAAFLWATLRGRNRLLSAAAVIGAGVMALALSAVVILPAVSLLSESTRAGGLSDDLRSVWSMHPLRLLEWIWPNVFGDASSLSLDLGHQLANTSQGRPGLPRSWALGSYVGLPIIALAAVAMSRRGYRWLLPFAGVFLLLALGDMTPVYGAYRTLVPIESLLRYPEKYVLGVLVVVAAAAGVGVSLMTRSERSPTALRALLIVQAAFAAVVLGVAVGQRLVIEWLGPQGPVDVEGVVAIAAGSGGRAAIVGLCFVGCLFAGRRWPQAKWLVPIVLLAELVAVPWTVLPVTSRGIIAERPELLTAVDHDRPAGLPPRVYRAQDLAPVTATRVDFRHQSLEPNFGARFGIAQLPGYDQGGAARFEHLWHREAANGAQLLALLAVDYAVFMRRSPPGFSTIAADRQHGWILARIDHRRPRGFCTTRWKSVTGDDDARAGMFASPPPSLSTTFVQGAPDDGVSATPTGPPAACTLHSEVPERVTLQCACPGAGYVVLADAWSPGWTATVDGIEAPIHRTDVALRAVRVSAGDHTIEMSYRAPGLRLGAGLSLAGWIAALVGFFVLRRQLPPT